MKWLRHLPVPFENSRHSGTRRQQADTAEKHPSVCRPPDDRILHCSSAAIRVVRPGDRVDRRSRNSRCRRAIGCRGAVSSPAGTLGWLRTGTTEVVAHAIEWLNADGMSELSSVCCIYATAPFVAHEDIMRGLEILESGNWQYVFAATPYAAPIFRSFCKDSSGGLKMFYP